MLHEAESRRVEPELSDRRLGQERVTLTVHLVLEQPVRDDHVRAGQLLASGTRPADELARVDDELEIELRKLRTGVAVAARRALDADEPVAEGEVALLHRVEEHRSVGSAVERVAEYGVSLLLVEREHPTEMLRDEEGHVREDILRMLERAIDDVARVARDVRDHEAAALGRERLRRPPLCADGHVRTLTRQTAVSS